MVQVLFFYLCNYAYEQAAGLAVPKGALRRIGTIVARRIDELM